MSALHDLAVRAACDAGVSYYADALTRSAAERDFGGVMQGRCLLVAEPNSSAACEALIGALNHRGVPATIRGTGYGQGGQSVALDTVSISTRRIDQIGAVDPATQTITVGAGATLKRVLAALEGTGLAPPVLPLNLDMSIGGLLSVGGMGCTSHRQGLVASNVARVEVVTAGGELRTCDRERNADLFQAVLGGVGQCGVITQATLELCPVSPRMKAASFLYDDASLWLRDQLVASDVDPRLHIEGSCWVAARGMRATPNGPQPYTYWTYGLHLSGDVELMNSASVRNLIGSLGAIRRIDEHEADFFSFQKRMEPRFQGMVKTGAWNEAHPWVEALIPLDGAEALLQRMFDMLPAEVGDGHRFMMVDPQRVTENFMCPPGRRVGLLGIFPVAFARSSLDGVIRALDRITGLTLEAKGRRYVSGWLGSDPAGYLRAHFGERYGQWLEMRRRYDPQGIFRSSLFPNGNRA
ncbi:putative oxidoreductase [Labilithrix luteola]|uniref:Putative oxidoreductase n=1 Tax=Labilithrix luteola TaxID=1391654 RepID=A0A0K1PV12_9BACT|nr:FAD-binding oxidoreductase [Labilithrix luteola]AKU97373.1 putative oxidoreductase [Labilithrix luteola]